MNLFNGHMQSSGIKRYSDSPVPNKLWGIIKGQIEKIILIDDNENNTFEYFGVKSVQYVIRIIGSQNDGLFIKSVIDSSNLGGKHNYSEVVREGDKAKSGPYSSNVGLGDDKDPSKKHGDMVLVAFINGNQDSGVIISGFPHPKNERTGPNKNDGIRKISEFNGIESHIDKNSNFRLRHRGRKNGDGKIENEKGVGTELILFENGDIQIDLYGKSDDDISKSIDEQTKDFRIRLTKEDKKLEAFINENEITVDELGINITDKNKNKIITNKNGVDIEDLSSNKATMDNNGIKIKENNGGELNLSGSKVALGFGSIEVLDNISKLAQEAGKLAQEDSLHIHPTGVGPSGPPTNSASYVAIKAACDTIEVLINNIKGSL